MRLAKPYLNHECGPLPPDVAGNITAVLWRYGYRPGADELLALGATPDQIARAVQKQKAALEIYEPADLVPIPEKLAAEIAVDLATFLFEEPEDGLRRLDERVVDWITDLRVEMYFDEPKHRGRPHVAVVLSDGKISVSLEDPPKILTPHGYRGEASAKKMIEKTREPLLKLGKDSRQDTQNRDPAKAKAPREKKKRARFGSR